MDTQGWGRETAPTAPPFAEVPAKRKSRRNVFVIAAVCLVLVLGATAVGGWFLLRDGDAADAAGSGPGGPDGPGGIVAAELAESGEGDSEGPHHVGEVTSVSEASHQDGASMTVLDARYVSWYLDGQPGDLGSRTTGTCVTPQMLDSVVRVSVDSVSDVPVRAVYFIEIDGTYRELYSTTSPIHHFYIDDSAVTQFGDC